MLKATEPLPPKADRSFGELANQLIDDAKAYGRAELDLAKAVAADKSRSLLVAAVLFAVATIFAIAATSALCVAIFATLATHMSALLAGLLTFVLVGGIAAGIGWLGWQKLREAL